MGIKRIVVAGILITNLIIPANAIEINSSTVPVTLDAETARFSVTVPTSLPVWVDADGGVIVADNAKIVNNSLGPVKVKGVSIQGLNGWSLLDYSQDTKSLPVDSKQAGFILNGDQTTSSSLVFNHENWPVILSNSEQLITYNSNIVPQSQAIQEEIAQVVFTIGWDLKYINIATSINNYIAMGLVPSQGRLVLPGTYDQNGQTYRLVTLIKSSSLENNNITSVVIPDTVTALASKCFQHWAFLESVDIPSSVTIIGEYAFSECNYLKSIELTGNIKKLEKNTFWYCIRLEDVTLPNTLESIGSSCFQACRNLKTINIPYGVTSIGSYAFYECKSLTSIELPATLSKIENSCFRDCTSLSNVIIPEGVTEIESSAFRGCNQLTDLTIPDSVVSIDRYAFEGVPHITYHGQATGSPWGALSMN